MTTTYTYNFSDGSQVVVSYDETSAQTTNPPSGYAVTSISGTWQGTAISAVNGQTGNYANDATGLGYYDNTIFQNMGQTGDGANSLGNLDGIDTAGLLFQLANPDGSASDVLVQLNWDGASADAYTWTSIIVGGTPNGSGTTTLSGFTACYAEGTRILTAEGEIPVEALRPGDRVVALNRFGLAEVRWIGHRRVHVARHPRPSTVAPITVLAGAFGPDRPHRDLRLSPDHAVYVDGALIPVRYLVNGATVTQEMPDFVTYHHVELDRHDVLLAEGLPAESYLDTGNRSAFANGGGEMQAHPDFALRTWESHGCAPLVTCGVVLQGVRAALLGHARTLGYASTMNSDLRVLADGRPLRVVAGAAGEIGVDVPPGATEVRLMSRMAAPVWMLPESTDHRRLGVAVRQLLLDGADLPDAAFGRGWYPAEPGLRWTDGTAVLRPGAGHLEMTLLPLLSYWDAPPDAAPDAAPLCRAAA
jgi:hypothetical protein